MSDPNESKHTPGPWVFDPTNYGVVDLLGYDLLDTNGNPIGVMVHTQLIGGFMKTKPNPKAEANAALVAAAPELLSACQSMLAYMEEFHVEACLNEPDCFECGLTEALSEAIAKATGV